MVVSITVAKSISAHNYRTDMMSFFENAGRHKYSTGHFHPKPSFQRGPKQNPGIVPYQHGSFKLRKNHLFLGIAAFIVAFLRFAPDYGKYVTAFNQAVAFLPDLEQPINVHSVVQVNPIGEVQEALPMEETPTQHTYSKDEFLDQYKAEDRKGTPPELNSHVTVMEPENHNSRPDKVTGVETPRVSKEVRKANPIKVNPLPKEENLYTFKEPKLYLMDKAGKYVFEEKEFEKKVRKIAEKLDVEASWLMAVMYSESQFNSSVKNFKGSGATGLIQFMPFTARELKVSIRDLKKMTPVKQLDYVYKYLDRVKARHGFYQSLTDLYLAILYPKAINRSMGYVLYAKPSITYKQNSGLDVNKDGKVTVKDIDLRMRKKFKTAYFSGRTR